jgi:hypothetical protein
MISAFERAKTVHALDRAATVTGRSTCYTNHTWVCWTWDPHIGDYEVYYLLGCDFRYSSSTQTFQRNLLTPFWRSEHLLCFLLADNLLGLLFDSEDAGNTFFRNVNQLLREYTMSRTTTQASWNLNSLYTILVLVLFSAAGHEVLCIYWTRKFIAMLKMYPTLSSSTSVQSRLHTIFYTCTIRFNIVLYMEWS